jgi:hypothetical protein
MLRESYTAPVDRNVAWKGAFASEPYECAWAQEAIFFVRTLNAEGVALPALARVQISPDGMEWVDEGTIFLLKPRQGLAFAKVRHFGGWLRIVGEVPSGELRVLVHLVLKA